MVQSKAVLPHQKLLLQRDCYSITPPPWPSGSWPATGYFGASADELMRPFNTPTAHNANPTATRDTQFDSAAYAAFRAVFDSSSEALLIISQGGEIQTANRRATELLKLKDKDPASQVLDEILPGSTSEELRSLIRGGQTFTATPRGADEITAPRSPIRVTLRSILPVSQHLLLALEESWNSHTTAFNERHLEAELRVLLDSVQPGILIVDLQGRIRWSNPRFAELLGLPGLELESIKKVDELSRSVAERLRNPQVFSARWRAFLSGHRGPAHDDIETVGSPPRLIERFSRTVSDHGSAVGWLEIYSDVSDRRQTQIQSLQTEKMAALGKVVAGIAHELNNPLTTIMGNIQLLLARGLPAAAVSESRRIYQEAERARRIVKNLLYFARENKPDRSLVNLNEIVERTIALRSYELKLKSIRVQTDLAPNLPKTMADSYQLQQVVLNLLMNAEQALIGSPRRGVVKVRTGYSKRRAFDRVTLAISDNGQGIPAEIASRIFDPFFTTKPPGMGTGLGLSIVYGIVRQHDGEISFESEPGSGTKFIIELPLVNAPADYPKPDSVNRAGSAMQARPSRILVVEDEPTVAQLIVDVLQEEGHFATACIDSREGLDLLLKHSYDLVICDLRMPGMDGRSFFHTLERSKSPFQRRILFITGDTLSPSSLEFIESNRLPYLAKPFSVEELKRAVLQQLQANQEMTKRISRRRSTGKANAKRLPG
jgi:signal transduction histidine kinase/CheY-like chemotaxis protein